MEEQLKDVLRALHERPAKTWLQDFISDNTKKSRMEALIAKSTHWRWAFTSVIEMFLGITYFKGENGRHCIAMKAVKIEGRKHVTANNKTTIFPPLS